MSDALVRKVDLARDRDGLAGMDLSITSDHVAQVEAVGDGLSLEWIESAAPIERHFPLQLDADPWTTGWVVEEDGLIRGFLGAGYSPWNARTVIWHFYVDRAHRRRGFGRLLMENVFAEAKGFGATTVWVETSNVNYPGVLAYQRLGFEVCGFDLTLYNGTPNEGEFGVFLARGV